MEYIKRYFETEEKANLFISELNTLLNIPLTPESTTQTYTTAEQEEQEGCIYWYVDIEDNLNLTL